MDENRVAYTDINLNNSICCVISVTHHIEREKGMLLLLYEKVGL